MNYLHAILATILIYINIKECSLNLGEYLKGPAHSENEDLYFLAPARTKRSTERE